MADSYTDTFVGEDTLIVNSRVLSNFGYGTVVEVACPNAIAGLDIGKGGNAVFSLQENGRQADVTITVIKGSGDDIFLNALNESFKSNFESAVAITGSFISKVGDGKGKVTTTAWDLNGGIPTTPPGDKYDVGGDRTQVLMEYHYSFARGTRILS